ncbi:hypothetical protein ACLB2K_020535 [Fragaria x ananassa]
MKALVRGFVVECPTSVVKLLSSLIVKLQVSLTSIVRNHRHRSSKIFIVDRLKSSSIDKHQESVRLQASTVFKRRSVGHR